MQIRCSLYKPREDTPMTEMGALFCKCECNDLAATTDSDPTEMLERGEPSEGKNQKLPKSQKLRCEMAEIVRYSIFLAETLNSWPPT